MTNITILTSAEITKLKEVFDRSLNPSQQRWEKQPSSHVTFLSKQGKRQIGASYYLAIKALLRALNGHHVIIFSPYEGMRAGMRRTIADFIHEHTGKVLPRSGHLIAINAGSLSWVSPKFRTMSGISGDVMIDEAIYIDNLGQLLEVSRGIASQKGNRVTVVL